MLKSQQPKTEVMTWDTARKYLKRANPELVEHIDILDPGDELKLYKVSYPYGAEIIKDAELQIPVDGKLLPLSDVRVDAAIRNGLGYTETMPMGVVLTHGIEVHFSSQDYMIPVAMMGQGKIFALTSVLENEFAYSRGSIFSVTAGARSIFMLPKISNSQGHNRLVCEYDLINPVPDNLMEHFSLFKNIYHSVEHSNEDEWFCECLFFDGKWLENKVDFKWRSLRYFLLQNAWNSTSFWRDQVVSEFIISISQRNRGMKPDPYLVDTLKHLLAIGMGAFPGYGVANNDDFAPVKFLQKVYEDVYRLNCAPVIMQPVHFNPQDPQRQLYYSLNVPSLRTFAPKGKKLASKIADMRDLKRILKMISQEIEKNVFNIGDGRISLYTLAKHSLFEFYHTENDPYGEIRSAKNLPEDDIYLKEVIENSKRDIFNQNCSFFKGCIGVRKK